MADPIQTSIVKAFTSTEPEEDRATERDVQGESDPLTIDGLCPIVGIGASAGGLEAVTQMLRVLPPTTGMGLCPRPTFGPDAREYAGRIACAPHGNARVASNAGNEGPTEPCLHHSSQ